MLDEHELCELQLQELELLRVALELDVVKLLLDELLEKHDELLLDKEEVDENEVDDEL